jgi:hypothetical protein
MAIMSHHHLEAAVGKLLGDHRGDTAVVLDAKNFLSRFCHPSPPPTSAMELPPAGAPFSRFLSTFMSGRCAVVNCEKTTTNLG